MSLKNGFIIMLFLSVILQAKATGVVGDVLFIHGEKWDLMAKPIQEDTLLLERLINFIPKNRTETTTNPDGYVAHWKIKRGTLFLRCIEVFIYNTQTKKTTSLIYTPKQLKEVFGPYYKRGKIRAQWFSGELRAGKGELVRYVHSGFERNRETENVMNFECGKLSGSQIYHNYKKDGLGLMQLQKEIIKRFPWYSFPEYENKRLVLNLWNFKCTQDGHMADLNVRIYLPESSSGYIEANEHPLIKAVKETVKSIYPWEILYINGEYVIHPNNCVMPIGSNMVFRKE